MSVLETNGMGYAEKELEHNWAAEYARREIEQFRTETERELLKKKDLDEANQEHDELNEKLNTGLAEKADKTQYASINQAGLIKLYSGSGVNRSGLVVGEDGTTYVACSTNGGITRDGAGGLKIMDGSITSSRIGNGAVVTQKLADGCVTSGKLDMSLKNFTITWKGNFEVPKGFGFILETAENVPVRVSKILGLDLYDAGAIHSSLNDYTPTSADEGEIGDLWCVKDETGENVKEIYINGGIMPKEPLQPGEVGIQVDEYYWHKIYPHPEMKTETIYSTVPQRVGTWINGMPIWRVAFKQELTDEDRQRKLFDITGNLPIISMNDAFILNETAALYTGRPCMLEDRPLNSYDAHLLKGEWDLSGITNLSFFDGVYGWVEFGTQESNIIA